MTDSPRYIEDVFGPRGFLARGKPGYAPREGQIEMVDIVDQVFTDGGRCVVEAMTGTGKGFAYLVPAIYHAAKSERRTVVATSNKKLQHQLMDKDLPTLQKLLPWNFRFEVAKGRTNYVCNHNTLEAIGTDGTASFADGVIDWLLETRTGDFTSLNLRDRDVSLTKRRLALASSEECLSPKCLFLPKTDIERERDRVDEVARAAQRHGIVDGFPSTCFSKLAFGRLFAADIVVTNYHLLILHYVILAKTAGMAAILPPFDVLICDEAHNFPDIARGALGEELTLGALWRVDPKNNDLKAASEAFFGFLDSERARLRVDSKDTLWLKGPIHSAEVAGLTTILQHNLAVYRANESRLTAHETRTMRRYESAIERLNLLLSDELDDKQVRFVAPGEKRTSGVPILGSKRVDVSEFLESVWASVEGAVLTSATLTVNGEFGYVLRETGLDRMENTYVSSLESPFDFEKNSLMYVADLPDPSKQRPAWEDAVPGHILHLLRLNGGRAMCLFTSRKMMLRTRSVLGLAELPFQIYTQAEDSALNQRLFERFLEDKTSVLLGVASFREGADAPGDTCTMVIMDKIPFPAPSDPIMQALEQREENCFNRHALPRAAIAQKQGIGRLIRSVTDHGVVAILDPRLLTQRYGRMLLDSRPDGMPVTTKWEEVEAYVQKS